MALLDDSRQPLQWFGGLLSLVGTISGIAFLPDFPGKLVMFSVLGLMGIFSFSLAAWRFAKPERIIEVRSNLTDPDFDISWALGHRIYTKRLHKPFPTREQTSRWLSRYHIGVFQAYDRNQKLWGYFSLWPLTAKAFNQLKSGEIGESNLDENAIARREEAPFTYWYIADILKDDRPFDKRVSNAIFSEYLKPLMIHKGLQYLHRSGQFAPTFEMIALAVTIPGERILKRDFHFERILPASPYNPPHKIYVRAFQTKGLSELLYQLRKQINGRERHITNALTGNDK